MNNSLFCGMKTEVLLENTTGMVFFDRHPVSNGHLLIIPKQHKIDFFILSRREKQDIDQLLLLGKEYLDSRFSPDGYSIGFNCEEAAGQSVFHCPYHLFPRYVNDTPSPKRGVRGGIPEKMSY